MEIGIREAKNDLSKLIEAALGGMEIVITKRGKPLVRLVPEAPTGNSKKGRGCLRDIALPAGWDSRELDEEIVQQFEASFPGRRDCAHK